MGFQLRYAKLKPAQKQINHLDRLNSDWSRENAVEFWLNPSIGSSAKASFSEALSQWTNPQLVATGALIAVSIRSGVNNKINFTDDVVSNPKSLWGKSADDIAAEFNNAGYKATIEQSTRGSRRSTQVRIEGHSEISNIQVHPGGGRHVGPYYKISTSTQGKIKVVDPSTYIGTSGEKATIINYNEN